jgi:hypothetical protein
MSEIVHPRTRPKASRPVFLHPRDALEYHVSGAVARGEAEPIVAIPAHNPPRSKDTPRKEHDQCASN